MEMRSMGQQSKSFNCLLSISMLKKFSSQQFISNSSNQQTKEHSSKNSFEFSAG